MSFTSSGPSLKLTDSVLRRLQPARVFHEGTRPVSGMACSPDGALLAAATADDSLLLVDYVKGENRGIYHSKKYGIQSVRFTALPQTVLVSGRLGRDDSVRLWSLYDNRFIQMFPGHRDRVTSIAVDPAGSDQFATASKDGTIRLWDLRQTQCQGMIRLPEAGRFTAVEYDPAGLVLMVMTANRLLMYDTKTLDQGPFLTESLGERSADISCLRINANGNRIGCITSEGVLLLDAMTGQRIALLQEYADIEAAVADVSFSPDGDTISCGTDDGTIQIYSASTGKLIHTLTGHPGPVRSVQWSSKYGVMASACTNVALWIPKPETL